MSIYFRHTLQYRRRRRGCCYVDTLPMCGHTDVLRARSGRGRARTLESPICRSVSTCVHTQPSLVSTPKGQCLLVFMPMNLTFLFGRRQGNKVYKHPLLNKNYNPLSDCYRSGSRLGTMSWEFGRSTIWAVHGNIACTAQVAVLKLWGKIDNFFFN